MRRLTLLLATALAATGLALATAQPATAQPATASATAAGATAAGRYDVTLRASTSELVLGETVVLKGTVSPRAFRKEVFLEKKVEEKSTWNRIDTTTLNRKGRYRFEDTPSTDQSRRYRVVAEASKKRGKGVSDAVDVSVYRWYHLAQLPARESSYVYSSTVMINAEEFPQSLYGLVSSSATTASRDYNLARSCLSLEATAGMADDADEEASGGVAVVNDGATDYSGTFGLTESERIRLDLRGVFRLEVEFSTFTPQHRTQPALGSPRVLCSF